MHSAGMAATLKHFPGHGSVLEDTHFDDAVDNRSLEELRALDLVPFVAGIEAGADAVMMAHVVYPQVAPEPAGYSPRWMSEILRKEMGFKGIVIGDDIGMAAAEAMGGIPARIEAHLKAGCELILACSPTIVEQSLNATADLPACPAARVESLRGAVAPTWEALEDNPKRGEAIARLAELCPEPSSK